MKERRHTWRMLAAQQSDESGSTVVGQRPWDPTRMFDVDGRITRSEYWASLALTLPVLMITSVIDTLVVGVGANGWITTVVVIVGVILTLWIPFNASVLRAHDMGISWKWPWLTPILAFVLLFVVPWVLVLVGVVLGVIVFMIVLGSGRSQPGRNEWGPPVVTAGY